MTSPYELLVRFKTDGTVAGASVRTIEHVNGRDYESDPVALSGASDPAFAAFASQFSASVITERDSLVSQLAAANARIAELESALPWDRRIIDASAFLGRITQAELLDLFGNTDQTCTQIAAMLAAYRENDWPILLDSPEMQAAIAHLVSTSVITADRALELLRDSSQAEAYKAGE